MTYKQPIALIVGGTSGLGAELARLLVTTHEVHITGRRGPERGLYSIGGVPVLTARKDHAVGISFHRLELGSLRKLETDICRVLNDLPTVDLFVYAAGFGQQGTIGELSDTDLVTMNNVGLLAPAFFLRRLLCRDGGLKEFVAITSTSQWIPRKLEPMYTAVKAGLAMLAQSVALDEKMGKVLVAAPGGMKTPFWRTEPPEINTMLNPGWTAEQIVELNQGAFKYKFARIFRGPARVEVAEVR